MNIHALPTAFALFMWFGYFYTDLLIGYRRPAVTDVGEGDPEEVIDWGELDEESE